MAARMLHHTEGPHNGCGCGPKSTKDSGCEAVGYSDCPQTIKSIRKKSKRRICFDFNKASCGKCCELFYERIRQVEVIRSNPPNCPATDGHFVIREEFMDPYTGRYCFTLDATDARLGIGERFKIRVWARTPDTEEDYIEVYISVG